MTIEKSITEYTTEKEEHVLDVLDQLEKLLEESDDAGLDIKQIITSYRDLIVKGLLDPSVGDELVADLRIKHNL